jgi:hypothetical protein
VYERLEPRVRCPGADALATRIARSGTRLRRCSTHGTLFIALPSPHYILIVQSSSQVPFARLESGGHAEISAARCYVRRDDWGRTGLQGVGVPRLCDGKGCRGFTLVNSVSIKTSAISKVLTFGPAAVHCAVCVLPCCGRAAFERNRCWRRWRAAKTVNLRCGPAPGRVAGRPAAGP